ncbi:surface lipoprotein assembly modifier [Novosphingobium sp. MMS21-SN21R]|uniref:surface lipoprotein assembly modifier n=1 Tax=Novosphingobium sp. MMS21-SN21R TaxID=2969298 RepID=UPI0028871A45|nr:surface lipoprotein assembly modifier [Novosphingobium sp. MMS21-SN21R]MDT0508387.1 surface lipoprotein assembly modifier [Novosphingobium sp. MMS21-SN21R]
MFDIMPEQATDAPAAQIQVAAESLAEVERLITEDQLEEARARLTSMAMTGTFDNQVQFLLALLDIGSKRYGNAVDRLRQILIREPGTARVRLELGRALFLDGKYAAAERQFRLARAGQLPETVQQNVDRYLGAIRQRKRLTMELAFALAPDSNVNAGPASDAVTIYGLPFQLSDDAKASSGIGATADGAIEWAPPISSRTSLRLGGQAHHTQYGNERFNDSTVAAFAGTRVNGTRWTYELTGTLIQRWYGGRPYSRTGGGAFSASYVVNRKTELNGSVGAYSVTYPNLADLDGRQTVISAGVARALSPRSVVRATVGINWQTARIKPLANHRQTFAVEWFSDFPGGMTLAIAPSLTRIGYEAPLAAFGTTRTDWQTSVQTRVQSRRIDVMGFTPRLGYIYTHNASTIPLYRFTRNRFELGIVRTF